MHWIGRYLLHTMPNCKLLTSLVFKLLDKFGNDTQNLYEMASNIIFQPFCIKTLKIICISQIRQMAHSSRFRGKPKSSSELVDVSRLVCSYIIHQTYYCAFCKLINVICFSLFPDSRMFKRQPSHLNLSFSRIGASNYTFIPGSRQ